MNGSTFRKSFKVGDIVQSGGDPLRKNASRLEIIGIDEDAVRFRPIGAAASFRVAFSYIQLLLDNFDEIDPRSIQKTVNILRKSHDLNLDTTTENYAYGFAKALNKSQGEVLYTGEEDVPSELASEALAFSEGKMRAVLVDRYERDQAARLACIKHYGVTCKACGFTFEKTYGAIGHGFIHVHHIDPISNSKGIHKIDPVNDLIPLCANCHAMVHTSKPPLSIEQLREVLDLGIG